MLSINMQSMLQCIKENRITSTTKAVPKYLKQACLRWPQPPGRVKCHRQGQKHALKKTETHRYSSRVFQPAIHSALRQETRNNCGGKEESTKAKTVPLCRLFLKHRRAVTRAKRTYGLMEAIGQKQKSCLKRSGRHIFPLHFVSRRSVSQTEPGFRWNVIGSWDPPIKSCCYLVLGNGHCPGTPSKWLLHRGTGDRQDLSYRGEPRNKLDRSPRRDT